MRSCSKKEKILKKKHLRKNQKIAEKSEKFQQENDDEFFENSSLHWRRMSQGTVTYPKARCCGPLLVGIGVLKCALFLVLFARICFQTEEWYFTYSTLGTQKKATKFSVKHLDISNLGFSLSHFCAK